MVDFSQYVDFVTGPDATADCPTYDADGDGDVDLVDVGAFQLAFTG